MKSIPTPGHQNYLSDKNLLKRFSFSKHCRPQINLLKEIVTSLELKGKEKILDIGCGNGSNLIEIRNKYHFSGKLYGVDLAKGMIAIAKESNIRERAGIYFSQDNAENLSFPDNSFDVVILKHVLHNLHDPLKALQESRRVLRGGGKIAVAVNSKKTRLIFRKLKPQITRILKIDFFPDADGHLNLENIGGMFRKVFKKIKIVKFQSRVHLKSIKPYLDYIDSGRNFWGKVTNQQWRQVLGFSKKYLSEILKKNGEIKDYVTIGVITAKK